MSKKNISATIEGDLRDLWEAYCEEECINNSQMIEKLIRNHLKEKGKLKDATK